MDRARKDSRPRRTGSRCSGGSPSSRSVFRAFEGGLGGQTRTQGGWSQWLQRTMTGFSFSGSSRYGCSCSGKTAFKGSFQIHLISSLKFPKSGTLWTGGRPRGSPGIPPALTHVHNHGQRFPFRASGLLANFGDGFAAKASQAGLARGPAGTSRSVSGNSGGSGSSLGLLGNVVAAQQFGFTAA